MQCEPLGEASEVKPQRRFLKLLWLLMPFFFFVAGYFYGNFYGVFQRHEVPSNVLSIKVVSIYDGDTIFLDVENWPDIIGKRIGIRIKGIDTPELRDEREKVKALARNAKAFVVEKLRNAKVIEIQNLERDKYFRIVADVYVDGENLSELLLRENLAKKYDGHGKKPKWD